MEDAIDKIRVKRQVAIGLYPNDFIVDGRVIGSLNQAEAHLIQTIIDEHRQMAEEIRQIQITGKYEYGFEHGRLAGLKVAAERVNDLRDRQQEEVSHLASDPSTPTTQPT